MLRNLLITFICLPVYITTAQYKAIPSTQIYQNLQKLSFLGNLMYVAAHPDDENTNVIAHFANTVNANVTYLSLTRGDGGQNLIGPELREALGLIRTQELLAARKIDGGNQCFTRANDFGYSKHPDETFKFWTKDSILSDVILAFRKYKPDVIINRFNHLTPGTTHGHHTASAILSVTAFEKASDSKAFTKQLSIYKPHQAYRILFNESLWGYPSRKEFERAVKSAIKIPMHNYSSITGLHNNEIAALSRSQHKSQGFGTLPKLGEHYEYFKFIKGKPLTTTNLFEGINTTWSRVKNGTEIANLLNDLLQKFNFKKPSTHVPELIAIHKKVSALKDSYWKQQKLPLLEQIIIECLGLHIETYSNTNQVSKNDSLTLNIQAVNSTNTVIEIIDASYKNETLINNLKLPQNELKTITKVLSMGELKLSTPYYLEKEPSVGLYHVPKIEHIGLPELHSEFTVHFKLKIANYTIPLQRTISYKYKDRIKGQVNEPLFSIPKITVKPTEIIQIFNAQNEQDIKVKLTANQNYNSSGTLNIDLPNGWFAPTPKIDFNLTKGETKTYTFSVFPPQETNTGNAKITATVNTESFSQYTQHINYPHIPKQQIVRNSEVKLVHLNVKTEPKKIAYIKGAGDTVAENLNQIGLNSTFIDANKIASTDLSKFDVVILGIRALNKYPILNTYKTKFHNFSLQGGTLIVQYHTKPYNGEASILDSFFPYKLKISRNRVTNENAQVRFLAPNHKVLNTPNKITSASFEAWVQERGLYFASEWDSLFTPILGMNDVNEAETKGSLLIAKHGEGNIVYTGISFFRELPAGIAGAYHLLVNLINL